ncbi:MAG: TonB-dependent receptor [Candidatus Krumholzibacteriota bacterium]|nr:TonB-dependent receptor [Candidatus Krumholzibacteriota bacterium]
MKKHMSLGRLVAVMAVMLPVVLGASVALAEDTEEIVDMSLEELLNIKISIASQSEETITDSPAIVSTINMEDMKTFGVRTLKDALAHVPGIVIQDAPVGTISIMIRGLSETFNQKVFFLLEGEPYWMSSHGDIPLLGMPIEMIEKIEIIRGPGAVTYGTNASAGVINVILKKDVDRTQVAMTGGSHGLLNVSARHSRKFDGGHYYLGASNQSMSDGYDAKYDETVLVFPFSAGRQVADGDTIAFPTSGTIQKREEYFNIVGGLNYKGLNVMGHYFKQTVNGLGGAPLIFQKNDLTYQGFLAHLDYRRDISGFETRFFANYNPFFLELDIENFLGSMGANNVVTAERGKQQYIGPFSNNYRATAGASTRYKFSENGSMLLGLENEVRKAGEYQKTDAEDIFVALQSENITVNEFSSFLQLDWRFGKLRTVAGGRYVNNELAGSHVSPRASLIYGINEFNSVKLLYSEGFNSPVISQQELLIPFVIEGNKDLKAELIRSMDLAYTHATQNQILILSGYFIKTVDAIDRVQEASASQPQYQNVDGYERYGAELDFQRSFLKMKVMANLAYNEQGNEVLPDDVLAAFVPKLTFSLGIRYNVYQHHYLGLSERFISERGEVDYLNVTNFSYWLNYDKLNVNFTVENVFDENIQNPDVNSGRIPSIPGGPGRSFYAGVSYSIF